MTKNITLLKKQLKEIEEVYNKLKIEFKGNIIELKYSVHGIVDMLQLLKKYRIKELEYVS